jgi:hypothetical protein
MTYEQEFQILSSLTKFAEETGGEFFCVIKNTDDWDHTTQCKKPILNFIGKNGLEVNIEFTKENNLRIRRFLELELFNKEEVSKIPCYNIKPFFSYMKSQCNNCQDLFQDVDFYDMFLFAKYKNINIPEGISYLNLRKILREYIINKTEYEPIRKFVHVPLSTRVLPSIESNFVHDVINQKLVYPQYQIEGQDNGRLNATAKHRKAYNPHTLSMEQKKNLELRNSDEVFLELDFKSMEVFVLAKITNDIELNNMIHSNSDFYESLAQRLGISNRSNAKTAFIGNIYGMGSFALSKELDISIDSAKDLQKSIKTLFKDSFEYLQSKIEEAKNNGIVKDCLGRVRTFVAGEEYKAMNFSIQAPSSMICCEFLVKLHDCVKGMAKILFSVHDSYCLSVERKAGPDVLKNAINCLESSSDLINGLKLIVEPSGGKSLSSMKPLRKNSK